MSVVELIVGEEAERRLKQLCELSSKLWDEVNYARLRIFLERKRVDFKGTYKEFYEKYRPLIGSATVQQVLNRSNEVWRNFFRLLELRKEGKLPSFITWINPPGCGRRDGSSRALWTILKKDQYRIDGDRIILKWLGAIGWIEMGYKGLIHLRGEQGRLEIHYDADRRKWYAYVSFKVYEKAVKGDGGRCRSNREVTWLRA